MIRSCLAQIVDKCRHLKGCELTPGEANPFGNLVDEARYLCRMPTQILAAVFQEAHQHVERFTVGSVVQACASPPPRLQVIFADDSFTWAFLARERLCHALIADEVSLIH